jgi:putative membrane protein
MKALAASLTLGVLMSLGGCADNTADTTASGGSRTPGDGSQDETMASQTVNPGAATAPDTGTDPATDDFVRKARSSNELEILSSQLALEKSTDAKVTGFARQLISDHQAAGRRMKAILDDPQQSREPVILTVVHQQKLDRLERSGADTFDTDFRTLQVEAHQEAVDLFRQYTEHGTHSALRAFAAETLPVLEGHLAMAEDLPAAASPAGTGAAPPATDDPD